ncbi:MAG: hypothetical protein M1814_006425 [Vezdaea aestivalis]|nr:MAG: hypothetical protein M1814_006425 [Vezdaea aestivalis]
MPALGPAAIGQTIAVVDRSGKVISSSKSLLSVFKDAKVAYKERKAEITAVRQADLEAKRVQRGLESLTLDDRSVASRRTKSKSHKKRPDDLKHHSRRSSRDTTADRQDLIRRHTTREDGQLSFAPSVNDRGRSMSLPVTIEDGEEVDMELAYGEIPPPLPSPGEPETELKALLSKASILLDEANCLQHSATKTIMALQKDPEALAAVGLALAEISQMVVKVAPGVLVAMKGSFPAIFALLASPHFLVAAGVGVGITIVAIGGYKIVKKIQARNAAEQVDELREIDADVARIDNWRRGIELDDIDAHTETTVEGEFITPEAAALKADGASITSRRRRSAEKPGKKAKSVKSSKKKEVVVKKAKKESMPLRLLFKAST